jgi:hypothetical protein
LVAVIRVEEDDDLLGQRDQGRLGPGDAAVDRVAEMRVARLERCVPVRVAGVVGAVVDAEERFGVGAVLDDDFPPGVSFHADRRRMAGVVVLQAAPPAARVADGVVECVGCSPRLQMPLGVTPAPGRPRGMVKLIA